jgi:hypothetical protein
MKVWEGHDATLIFLNNKLVLISAKVKHVFCPNIFYNKGEIQIYKKCFVCLNGFFLMYLLVTETRKQKTKNKNIDCYTIFRIYYKYILNIILLIYIL